MNDVIVVIPIAHVVRVGIRMFVIKEEISINDVVQAIRIGFVGFIIEQVARIPIVEILVATVKILIG